MKFRLQDYVQRELNFAIVDEVDSILIDEARTPLIISGPAEDATDKYYTVDQVIPGADPGPGLHRRREEPTGRRSPTTASRSCRSGSAIANLYDPEQIETLHHVEQALRAHTSTSATSTTW